MAVPKLFIVLLLVVAVSITTFMMYEIMKGMESYKLEPQKGAVVGWNPYGTKAVSGEKREASPFYKAPAKAGSGKTTPNEATSARETLPDETLPEEIPLEETLQEETPVEAPLIMQLSLLTNGDFSAGMENWKTLHEPQVQETWGANVLSDTIHENALAFWRNNSNNVPGRVSVQQTLDADVSMYSTLVLKADINIISYNHYNVTEGTYPAYFYIYFIDANNVPKTWTVGFVPPNNVTNVWRKYTSANLISTLAPVTIEKIEVGGNGYDFYAMIDNIELIVE